MIWHTLFEWLWRGLTFIGCGFFILAIGAMLETFFGWVTGRSALESRIDDLGWRVFRLENPARKPRRKKNEHDTV